MWENVGECGNVGETGKVVQVWTLDVVIHLGENVERGTGLDAPLEFIWATEFFEVFCAL